MFQGFLSLGGDELVNNARTAAYIRNLLPNYVVHASAGDCVCNGMHTALGHGAYSAPTGAPWYRANTPETAKFYGLYATSIEGIENSTRQAAVTELMQDGAVHALPRHASKEVRVRGVMFAADDEGMSAGMAYLRSILDDQPCGPDTVDCTGRNLQFFMSCPGASTTAEANQRVAKFARVMYRVEPLSGPTVLAELNPRLGKAREVEFILSAGVPFIFTLPQQVATTTGVTPGVSPQVNCDPVSDPYDDLVVDPNSPNVVRPPRPPLIKPIAMPQTWNRYSMTIPASLGMRWGRLVPIVRLVTTSAAQRMVRIRFYRPGNRDQCDYEGEFLVTYMPAGATLVIDGTTQEVRLQHEGRNKPAGNLVVGSDGRPVRWPAMACQSTYTIIVDTPGALTATVRTDIAVRE